MNRRLQSGNTWIIVLLVVLVVLAIVWMNQGGGTNSPATSPTVEQPGSSSTAGSASTQPSAVGTPTKSTAPTMTASGAYLISYTTGGFSPKNLTIPVGKAVHIVNNSSYAMLVLPIDQVHRPYASFMQSKSVGRGAAFDYTFTDRGVYGYYNGDHTASTGLITVN